MKDSGMGSVEIERSTFYYHFKNKYDLVAWIFFQSAEKINIIDAKDAAANSMPDSLRRIFFDK